MDEKPLEGALRAGLGGGGGAGLPELAMPFPEHVERQPGPEDNGYADAPGIPWDS